MKADLRIEGGTLVLPGEGLVRAALAVRDGKIAAIGDEGALPSARKRIDATGLHVLPGLVDPHGHMGLNDDFAGECETETRAALKGGVTTIGLFIRTPGGDYLDDIPDLAALVGRTAFIDVFFTLNIADAEQVEGIPRYAERLGIHSYKFYMWSVPGGKPLDDALLFRGFRQVAKLGRKGLACVHAETKALVDEATERVAGLSFWKGSPLKRYTASHPPLAEALAIETAAHLAAAAGARLYIVHLSSRDGLETAGRLKAFMPDLTLETTPHHLNLTEEHGAGTLAKIAPPVRDKSHPEALWKGLIEGRIDTIGTDNLPRRRAQKVDHWREAVTGFPGYGTLLPLMIHEGHHMRKIPLEEVVAKVTANPARAYGFYPRKGALGPGSDADIVLVDLKKTRTVRWKDLGHWSDFSAYEGMRLKGWPVMTLKGGKVACADGEVLAKRGSGEYLRH